ncbi:glycoside hydrolase family 2 protein [Chitinophaga sp. SYP-B3965]|uniref:glycoside hydrolase family 2 protein n=1 Tax=Chitinophaga sp. SYP-B3965 TaxID=2663120 RepID=UPI0015630E12|nr:glycoside hydrolase family 2 TIM barrel-domain containing protein [Chitinophaga sp. SYP-B3965]
MKRCFLLVMLMVMAGSSYAQSLNGGWLFALDPLKIGEQHGWTAPGFPDNKLDKVTVPHSYSVDKRFFFYTGAAWYFRKFDAPVIKSTDKAFINFDAVFYKCDIWFNGTRVGSHEGGYTPFTVDVTKYLQQKNTLSVRVDNSWDTTTIPGAKTWDTTYSDNASQLYPWINYGGITKPVALQIRPADYLSNIKIEAEPDLQKGTARIFIRTNGARVNLYSGDKKLAVSFKPVSGGLLANLTAKDVQLWDHDHPYLYTAEVIGSADTIRSNFGIRKIEVKNAQLLLNGHPIKMGGCNRPADYPGTGSLDPDSVLQRDLTLIKSSGMELSRIAHHAVSKNLLDWADKHGMLIITEAGNWQLTPKQMADPMIREKFKSQMKEMVERDWNHPSVIAYSLGNEFYAYKPEGLAWVRDMKQFAKTLDPTRLITFASYTVFRDYIKKPEDEASQYVDFVSANVYAKHAEWVAHIHELYPDKPVFISEFGIMATSNKTEADRIKYLKDAIAAFRKADYVIGASIWTFNDYLSRYPQTNPDGYRSWGVVGPDRQRRDSYYTLQEEFSPALIEIVSKQNGKLTVRIRSRADFPAYTLKGYKVKHGGQILNLPVMQPGDTQTLTFDAGNEPVELIKPGDFVILTQKL